MYVYILVYIYKYIFIYICVCLFIYIYDNDCTICQNCNSGNSTTLQSSGDSQTIKFKRNKFDNKCRLCDTRVRVICCSVGCM